jgi:Mitochondrial ribosomal protein (VAR1)
MKNNIVKPNKPFIFSKKLNDNNKIIPLKKVKNTLGPMRYFPPANQEWNNSIYVYNNMTIKNISIAQKNLTRLIKSYFNIYFSKNLLSSKRILTRFRRLAINKIFVSKAELKHTNNKIIITLYIYNEERRILIHRLKRIEAILFPYYAITSKEVYKDFTSFLSLKERLNLIKKEDAFSFLGLLEEIKKYITEEIKLEKKNLEAINKLNFREEKLLKVEALEESLKKILAIISSCESDPLYFKQYENIYRKFISKTLLEKEITTIAYYKLLLNINKYKFEDLFLSRLSPLISKIYNKEVEFNIVNLKAVYLNSDIFTQAIALKLRNRNNRLLRVLRSFLYMVKLPKVNILKERFAHINIKNL